MVVVVTLVAALAPVATVHAGGPRAVAASALRSRAPVPEMSAQAAIVIDLTTGFEALSHNADARLPPASTIKIVTALVARSILDLDAQVTIQEGDILDPTVFSNMELQPGDVVSVRTLLHGLLIPSGADAAMALAREAGQRLEPGTPTPVERFVAEMNAWAGARGMRDTNFVNPVGADDPNQFASARDLVRATEALLNDWLLARIVAIETMTVEIGGPNARQVTIVNSNQLIARDDVFGVKTGTEETAGQCLIAGFWRGDNQLVAVVLGSGDRYLDMDLVMGSVDSTYRWLALGIGAVSLGASDAVAAQGLTFMTRRTLLMTVEQAEQLTWTLRADTGLGMRRGDVAFDLNGRVVARLSLYSAGSGARVPRAA